MWCLDGKLVDILEGVVFQRLPEGSQLLLLLSSAKTVRTVQHYQQNRTRLKKPSGTVYRAHLRSGCSPARTAFSQVIVRANFSAGLAFTSNRVSSASVSADVQDHKHRDRVHCGSCSRGPCHLYHWRDFSDVFLHVHAKKSCTRTRCVTSRWTDLPRTYLGRSLSRSSSPTTMWFLDGTHCMMRSATTSE